MHCSRERRESKKAYDACYLYSVAAKVGGVVCKACSFVRRRERPSGATSSPSSYPWPAPTREEKRGVLGVVLGVGVQALVFGLGVSCCL